MHPILVLEVSIRSHTGVWCGRRALRNQRKSLTFSNPRTPTRADSFSHDPLISCDLKSAAFDLAWLLPHNSPASSDLSIQIVGVWEDGGPRRI